ncbi:MAG: 2-oxoacid:acceptor oxidoreductase family protein [Promethearchaeota archaeon]
MNFNNFTIVITGLGGQGSIRLLQILGQSLVSNGFKVITSETHGLSQRGGNVTCFLRFGNKLNSPIPLIGSADMIIALEESSILNVLKYAKGDKSTLLVISTYEKKLRSIEYPPLPSLLKILFEISDKFYFIPASEITLKFTGDLKYMNILILGYILRFLPIDREKVDNILRKSFSGKTYQTNMEMLDQGIDL